MLNKIIFSYMTSSCLKRKVMFALLQLVVLRHLRLVTVEIFVIWATAIRDCDWSRYGHVHDATGK